MKQKFIFVLISIMIFVFIITIVGSSTNILINKAEHLDENKVFISNIYEQVKELDGVWSEPINNNEYVRITFEQKLDSSKDITVY